MAESQLQESMMSTVYRLCAAALLALFLAPSVVQAERQSYVALVFSNPKSGMEDEYTRWYDTEHLPAVVSVPGFVSGQRFRLAAEQMMKNLSDRPQYLALYRIETDDLRAVYAEVERRIVSGQTRLCDCMSRKGGMNLTYQLRHSSLPANAKRSSRRHFVLTNAMPGEELKFVEWYDHHHAPEVAAASGFTGRYALGSASSVQMIANASAPFHLAIFGIGRGDLADIFGKFSRYAPGLTQGPAFASLWSGTYEAIGPVIRPVR